MKFQESNVQSEIFGSLLREKLEYRILLLTYDYTEKQFHFLFLLF